MRLRSLLRRQPESARAAEDAYFAQASKGTVFPTPDGPQSVDAASGSSDPDAGNPYEALSYAELQQEIRDRNEGRSDDDRLTVSGRTEVLVQRLLDDDEAQLASV
jgi:hypothetical protein